MDDVVISHAIPRARRNFALSLNRIYCFRKNPSLLGLREVIFDYRPPAPVVTCLVGLEAAAP
jgi:hypothetical protein